MPTGSLKKWFNEKGFGFITPDDATSDIFAPKRSFQGASEADIREGARVHFESELEERTNKMKASKWTVLDAALGGAAAVAGLQTQLLGGLGAAGLAGLGIPGLATPGLTAYGAIPGLATPQLGAIPGLSPYGVAGLGAVPGVSLVQATPTLTATPAALPPGWEQVTDPATNRPYWCNRATGESSWTPPQAAAAPVLAMATPGALSATGIDIGANSDAGTAPAPLADGSVGLDAAAVAAAAAFTATGLAPTPLATSGTCAAIGVAPDAAATSAPVAAATNGVVALPAGWEQATDPNTNRPYYFNRATGQTSWTVPA